MSHSPLPSAGEASSRLRELDALRGIAALLVVWFHYTVQFRSEFHQGPETMFAMPAGRYGVQLFFVISGFVIFLTLTRSRSLWDFAANRLSRLYPPYWVCMLITAAVLAAWPLSGLEVNLRQVVVNLTMVQYWLVTPHVDSVYWTLSVELAFYAFVSVLRLIGWLDKVERWVAAWLGLQFIVHFGDHHGFHISPLIRSALLLDHGHFFFTGVIFHRIREQGGTLMRWSLIAACIVMAWFIRDVPHALSLVVAAAAFAAFIHGKLGWMALPPLLFFGDISYPLYLIHQNVGYVIIDRLIRAGHDHAAWLWVPALASVLLATLVHLAVEKPAREFLRGWWKRSTLRARVVGRS